MAELSHPFVCDICTVLKGAANHWYRVWRDNEGLVVLAPWDYYLPETKHQHACGEDHALKLAARLLGKPAALPDSPTDPPSA